MLRWRCSVVLLLGSLLSGPGEAAQLGLKVDRLDQALLSVHGLDLRLDWPAAAQSGRLDLRIAELAAPDFGQHFRAVRWQCELRRAGRGYVCEGPVEAGKARISRLRVDLSSAENVIELGDRKASLRVRRLASRPDELAIVLRRVPVAWLRAWMQTLWADGKFSDGRVDAEVGVRVPDDAPVAVDATVAFDRLAFDTPDGVLAGASLAGDARVRAQIDARSRRVSVDGHWRGGELLAGSLYASAPKRPLLFALDASRRGDAGWRLSGLRWHEAGVVDVSAEVTLDAELHPTAIKARADAPALAGLASRYLGDLLDRAGLRGTQLSGAAQAELEWAGGEMRGLSVKLDQVNAASLDGRFAFAGLDGGLQWARSPVRHQGELRWQAAALYGLGFGAGAALLESVDGDIRLRAPVRTALLGGHFELSHLELTPRTAGQSARMRFGLALEQLDLQQLSQQLGWPAFSGSVSGVLPDARYADNRLGFEGGIVMRMFDGEVRIEDLVMERPLGVAPTLGANVVYDNLDLQPLTAAFGFGEITGRLDGSVRNLRLLDWSPVQFDADFHSRPGYSGKRRISQRAVRDLTEVGGGGLAAGLQGAALKMFNNFRYSKLGLKCRLRDNVCEMDGVGSAGQGYTIVEGSGLPNIQVVGFSRRVDWPTLVARLKSVSRVEMNRELH